MFITWQVELFPAQHAWGRQAVLTRMPHPACPVQPAPSSLLRGLAGWHIRPPLPLPQLVSGSLETARLLGPVPSARATWAGFGRGPAIRAWTSHTSIPKGLQGHAPYLPRGGAGTVGLAWRWQRGLGLAPPVTFARWSCSPVLASRHHACGGRPLCLPTRLQVPRTGPAHSGDPASLSSDCTDFHETPL